MTNFNKLFSFASLIALQSVLALVSPSAQADSKFDGSNYICGYPEKVGHTYSQLRCLYKDKAAIDLDQNLTITVASESKLTVFSKNGDKNKREGWMQVYEFGGNLPSPTKLCQVNFAGGSGASFRSYSERGFEFGVEKDTGNGIIAVITGDKYGVAAHFYGKEAVGLFGTLGAE